MDRGWARYGPSLYPGPPPTSSRHQPLRNTLPYQGFTPITVSLTPPDHIASRWRMSGARTGRSLEDACQLTSHATLDGLTHVCHQVPVVRSLDHVGSPYPYPFGIHGDRSRLMSSTPAYALSWAARCPFHKSCASVWLPGSAGFQPAPEAGETPALPGNWW